ncbi:MAG: MATE family efflux transporter, partial [Kordiimonadaceae bacterium]|nr:MATE family efflux transporter [Kordiimonadaceae bacterium]
MAAAKQSPRVDLTVGPVHKHLIRMALPMILGLSASMSFTFVDLFYIGMLGTDELAAMGFITRMIMIIISASIGLSAGISSVIARAAGNKDQDEIKRLATNTLILTFLISISFTLIGLLTIDPLFMAMGADEAVMPFIREYVTVWYFSPLFIMLPMTGGAVMRALGDTKLQGNLMLFAAMANAVLDPIFIFGLFGFPELGFVGAAWATLITRFFSFAVIMYALYYQYHVICFEKKTLSQFSASVKRIMHVGIPATGTNMIIPIVAAIVISIIARYGTDAVAATNVATTIESLSLVLFFSLSSVVGPFIGQNLGAGNFDRIEECINKAMLFCLAWGGFMAILLALLAPFLASLFSDDPAINALTVSYLYVVPLSYGLYGLVMSVNAMFNSIGNPMPGVAISCLRVFFLQLPLVYVASQLYDLETA